jgi:hypothetical protein
LRTTAAFIQIVIPVRSSPGALGKPCVQTLLVAACWVPFASEATLHHRQCVDASLRMLDAERTPAALDEMRVLGSWSSM